ncbi:MAG: flippase [Candidatus Thorarchaeota archaeon]
MENYTRTAVRGAGFIFLFSVLGAIFSYSSRIFLSRHLTLEEFGLFFAVFALFNFLALFKDFGLGQSMVRYISLYRAKGNSNKVKTVILMSGTIQMILTLLVAVALIFLSDYLTKNYFKNELAFPFLIILSVWYITGSLQGTIFQVFLGLRSYFLYSTRQFLRNFLYFVFLIILFYVGLGNLSPAYAWLATSVVILIVFLPLVIHKFNIFKYKLVEKIKTSKELLLFGLPVTLTMVGSLVISYTDTLMLTYFKTLEDVGVYNVILPTALFVLFIGKSLASVIFPMGSELEAKNQLKKLSSGLSIMIKYSILFMFPVALSLIFFANTFLKLFFGSEYVVGVLAFRILIFGVLIYMLGEINNSTISSIGKPRKVTFIILIAAILNVIMNLFLIPAYGMVGAAISTFSSYFVVSFMSSREISKLLGVLKFDFKSIFKTFLGGILFFVALSLTEEILSLNVWVELVLSLVIASLIYILYLFISKLLSLNEVRAIVKKIF